MASLFARPPWGRPLPALDLAADPAVLTALGNDVGFELVFSRQLIAHAAPGDIAVGLSTSGNSRNLLAAFREARSRRPAHDRARRLRRRRDGAGRADVQHCLVVPADSVHRIQETQAALGFALWSAVQSRLEPHG